MQDQRSDGGAASQEARELGSEVGQIAAELKELLGLEAELAKAEVNESRTTLTRGAILAAAAAYLAVLATVFLFLSLMFGLDTQMPTWAAALITTLILALLALALGLAARHFLRAVSFKPKRFMANVKEDLEWARSLMTSKVR